jgi:hypothetical protein
VSCPNDFPLAFSGGDRIFGFLGNRAVAQLGSALEWGSRGRGFESRRPEGERLKQRLFRYPKIGYTGLCGPELVEFSAKNLKQFTANEGVQHHAKNRQAMTLKPFWRVSISCNGEPESLMILPPIDESLSDKVIIFQAKKKPMPMPTQTDEIRTDELFWYALRLSSIAKELVRFLRSFEALVGARPGFNGNAARQKSFSMIKEACSIEARHHIVIGLEAQSPIKGLNFTAGNQ